MSRRRGKSTPPGAISAGPWSQPPPACWLRPEAFNVCDAEVADIEYFFESQLRGEPEPVSDIHFHAAIPRSARVALQVSF